MRYGLLLLFAISIGLCGPTEREKESADSLDQAARQLDAAYQNWDSDRMSELNMLNASDFFSKHREAFKEVRTSLARRPTNERHRLEKSLIDSLVTSSVQLIELREFVIKETYELRDFERGYGEDALTKREMVQSMMRAFANDFDSTEKAFRRQVQSYNSSVNDSPLLEDSLRHYKRLLEMDREMKNALRKATKTN